MDFYRGRLKLETPEDIDYVKRINEMNGGDIDESTLRIGRPMSTIYTQMVVVDTNYYGRDAAARDEEEFPEFGPGASRADRVASVYYAKKCINRLMPKDQ